ncbi:MAG: VWA domain-containing protein [Janthinobacterium lividum]
MPVRFGRSALVFALLTPCACGSAALAQQTPASAATSQAPTTILTVQSQLVLVPTEVRTKKGGENIYGLHAEDFTVEADGVPQRVQLDESGAPVPLSLVVMVQCSRTAFREGPKIRGLATMVDAIVGGGPAKVAVVDFGTEPELLTGLTADPDKRDRAFAQLQPCDDDGGVATYDAVAYGNEILERAHAPGRRVVLLVSETRDHGSLSKPDKTIAALNRTNTVVDAVAFSPARDEVIEDAKTQDGATGGIIGLVLMAVQALRKNAPKEFARETGGEYINFSNEKGFDRSLNTLANRIHNGYQLSFVPHFPADSAGSAPGLHALKVRVPKYPDAVIEHREAYWNGPPQ